MAGTVLGSGDTRVCTENVLLLGNFPSRGERQRVYSYTNPCLPAHQEKESRTGGGALPGCVLCVFVGVQGMKTLCFPWKPGGGCSSREARNAREVAGDSLLKKQPGGRRAEVEWGGA